MTNSNEASWNKRRDRAIASLALGIKDQEPVDVLPVSDDELFAFHQDQLSAKQRAQIMHSIANDNDVYNRWINLVQTMDLVDELEQEDREAERATQYVEQQSHSERASNGQTKLQKWDLAGRFSSWFNKEREWASAFGTAAGVAFVAILAVLVLPKMNAQPTIDELYDQYSSSGSAILPDKSINLSSGRDKPYSATETELAKGIVKGLEELNIVELPSNWRVNPDLYADAETVADGDEKSVFALGRLVALSLVQCKVAKDELYFKSAAPLMRNLAKQHDSIAPEATVIGDTRADVCRKATTIIDQIN